MSFFGKLKRRRRRLAELDQDREVARRESIARKYRVVIGADKPAKEDPQLRENESKYGDKEE